MCQEINAYVAVVKVVVLQLSATEMVEPENIGAPAEQQQPVSEPCGRPVTDNVENLCSSTLARGSSSLTDAERRWLARYPCLDRHQLAELREAFLVFAVDAPAMTPRTAAAVADSARLNVTDIGTCLRAVGQNPTKADLARIAAVIPQPQQPEDGAGAGLPSSSALNASAIASNRALFPAATKQQSSGRGLTVASDIGATSRLSADESLMSEVAVCFRLC